MLIQLTNCTVSYHDEVLFKPEYGTFDMAIGTTIISAYAGSADHNSFPNLYKASKVNTIKASKSSSLLKLEKQYATVRQIREKGVSDDSKLNSIVELIQKEYPQEWLLILEILEIAEGEELKRSLSNSLNEVIIKSPKLKTLISEGMKMLELKKN